VAFKSLADAWCDTTTPHGKLFTVIFAGLAEFERELIMARTREGISKARADGVKFGRKPYYRCQRCIARLPHDAGIMAKP
jgi:DNA invertase Pin-like site-specific DNA recombinase